MSDVDTFLYEPRGGEPIPLGTLIYLRVRNKQRLHEILLDEFVRSGITQAELARRTGKSPEVVCRTLGAPGNLRLDTVSDFLFAMSGAEAAYAVDYPLRKAKNNDTEPEWALAGRQLTPPPPPAQAPTSGTMTIKPLPPWRRAKQYETEAA